MQIDDYVERGIMDRALELTLRPVEKQDSSEKEEVIRDFFAAHFQNEIATHPRYLELYEKRQQGQALSDQELRDLKMWFSLAWCAPELRGDGLELPSGRLPSVRRFIERGRDFTQSDIEDLVQIELAVLRAVVPFHKQMQDAGQIEVSTTPLYHPILPLLIDSDQATLDRQGTRLPRRFAHPEDADVHVARAVLDYHSRFGRAPRGMWPAEGAVSQACVVHFARHGVRWIASDRGVLARSGRFGYDVEDPDVLCQPYRVEEQEHAVSIFFRDSVLADAIGFRYQRWEDAEAAAEDFVRTVKDRFARRVSGDRDRVVTVALDGENPWGGYRDSGRPFLAALYRRLATDSEIGTVTFSDYLDANPLEQQTRVHDLFTGSWADEPGSEPGVELGTWIGEEEENRAWELLATARDALVRAGATPKSHPEAYEAIYAAEGSDWFWWFGTDQDSGNDSEFDALFRAHLRRAYEASGLEPPSELESPIAEGKDSVVVWGAHQRPFGIGRGERILLRFDEAGSVEWQTDDAPARVDAVVPSGGVMAGVQEYVLFLGPFPRGSRFLRFRFRAQRPSGASSEEHEIRIGERGRAPVARSESPASPAQQPSSTTR